MSDIPGGETICILKGVFECNLMEWKPQYLFEYTNSTVRLISDDCFFVFICTFFFFFNCFAFPFAQSGLKDFTFTCCFIFGSETQAGCSSVVGLFCYFILFYFFYFVGLERRLLLLLACSVSAATVIQTDTEPRRWRTGGVCSFSSAICCT